MGLTTSKLLGLIEIDTKAIQQTADEPLAELLARWMSRTLENRKIKAEHEVFGPALPAASRFQPPAVTLVDADFTALAAELGEHNQALRSQLVSRHIVVFG